LARRIALVVALVAIVTAACNSQHTSSSVFDAAAALTGPITTGHVIEPLTGIPSGLSQYGYTEQEFFASGKATAFRATASPGDGRWSVEPTTSAEYRTRVLVRRPTNAKQFNGTVVVEWFNVSAGESAPDWDYLNPELMRSGFAYVGVSAQALGVQGGAPILGSEGGASGGLVKAEPARYGTLHHPGDQYALDIFAQVGEAIHDGADPALLGGLHPTKVVAVGESQSAFYLTTFADALQPHVRAFDGIFIHSRGGTGASLTGAAITANRGTAVQIRTDLTVPVFMFETQTDLIQLGYAPARQPDSDRIRTWEVAGTSHADSYLVGSAAKLLGCTTPVNDGPQHVVVQAAFAAFAKWVAQGVAPPSPGPFELAGTHPPTLAFDAHGNVVGGVRTPAVDVPVSTLSGAPPEGASPICSLFGSTTPLRPSVLTALYGSKQGYLTAYEHSLDQAIAGGFILPADRAELIAQAQQVNFPS
jgi:hypothetical protein